MPFDATPQSEPEPDHFKSWLDALSLRELVVLFVTVEMARRAGDWPPEEGLGRGR